MRTQFIESLILGVIIGAAVLLARWLVPNRLLFEVGFIVVAAVLLTLVQLILVRRRSEAPSEASPPAAPPLAVQEAQTPIHSPQLGWAQPGNAELPAIGEPTLIQAANEPYPTAIQVVADEDQHGVASDAVAQETGETEKKVV
jgi:hypothetical protein